MAEPALLSGEPWYTCSGTDGDVVVSTRVRFARNLANFQFPDTTKNLPQTSLRKGDYDRVRTLVFDSFSHLENADNFHLVNSEALDSLGVKILEERGVIDESASSGIVMRSDGRLSCLVNSVDHVRIASFAPGLSCESVFADCRAIDESLQQTLQFAASFDFGYLTASINDAGSGMKLSLRVHLPSVSFSGEADNILRGLREKGLAVTSVYGAGGDYGVSLGSYYQISTISSFNGSEIDQIASLESAGRYVVETERKFRAKCAENKPTAVHNIILRAFASAKFSVLMPLRESIGIISAVKWGLDMGIIRGIDDSTLCGLLYRVQNGHLEFLLKNGNFAFENDIKDNLQQKTERLRALILQEAFEKINFVS
jgi:protein arginine kinase